MVYDEDYDASKDPNYIDNLTIGTIIFEDIFTEDEISANTYRPNFGKKVGECKIHVYGGEYNVPHFHIVGTNGKFESCVCIYSNNYFSHGGKYKDKLSGKQCKQLDEWLRLPVRLLDSASNWQFIMVTWEHANQDCKFPEYRKTRIQPDYSTMANYKDR